MRPFQRPFPAIPATVELDGVVMDGVGTRYKEIHLLSAKRIGQCQVHTIWTLTIDFRPNPDGPEAQTGQCLVDPTFCKEYGEPHLQEISADT